MSSGFRSVWECVRAWVVTCRVATCCCVAPLRIGLMLVGYINLIVALVMIVGTATGMETFSPIVSRIQAAVLEDDASVVWILAPAADLAASVMLLCAIYTNDVKLCRLFMYFTAANILASVIMYAIVIAAIELLNLIMIALSIGYQTYVIILVRSYRIELKLRKVTDKTKMSYDNRCGIVTITDVSEPSTEIKLKDVRLEILDGKDVSIRGNTLPRSGTLQSSKSDTMRSDKSSVTTATTSRPLVSSASDDPGASSETNVPKTTHDVGVSVTPLQILTSSSITSRPYLTSDKLKNSLKKDVSQNVQNVGTVTTTAVVETVKETPEDTKTDKKSDTGDAKEAEATNTEVQSDVPKKKKRGIFSKKSKTKQSDNVVKTDECNK